MKPPFFYATGRRKTSVARVYLSLGTGKITVNNKSLLEYFRREILKMTIMQPLELLDAVSKFDIEAYCSGGGLSGQAGALRLGMARALIEFDPELKPSLRKHGFVTRDPRAVERKKYGRPKARKRFQYSKR
ncbi:MAG: 30S ribosomal protein S9 [bacterium]|nr:30S ribosomal protein S9 [bacterium]